MSLVKYSNKIITIKTKTISCQRLTKKNVKFKERNRIFQPHIFLWSNSIASMIHPVFPVYINYKNSMKTSRWTTQYKKPMVDIIALTAWRVTTETEYKNPIIIIIPTCRVAQKPCEARINIQDILNKVKG